VRQVATVISSIRSLARVCQGADRVVLVGKERVIRVRGPRQAVEGIVRLGDDGDVVGARQRVAAAVSIDVGESRFGAGGTIPLQHR